MLHCSLAFWNVLPVVYCFIGHCSAGSGSSWAVYHCTVCATSICSVQIVVIYVMTPISAREANKLSRR